MSNYYNKRSNNQQSSIVFVLLILALSLVLVVTISTHGPYLANAQVQNITRKGTFNYTQSDASGDPDWIDTEHLEYSWGCKIIALPFNQNSTGIYVKVKKF
jgi:hypothetical protein